MRIVSRRQILTTGCSLGAGGIFLPAGLLWAAPPNQDPAAHLGLAWTANLKWAKTHVETLAKALKRAGFTFVASLDTNTAQT